MARSPARNKRDEARTLPIAAGGEGAASTGRLLVLLEPDGIKEGIKQIRNIAGVTLQCSSADYGSNGIDMAEANASEGFILENLGVAILNTDPNQHQRMLSNAADATAIRTVEREGYKHAIGHSPIGVGDMSLEYFRGYRDAVNHLYETAMGGKAEAQAANRERFQDDAAAAWGLYATGVPKSNFSGRGVRVAVLDTGFDLAHPDFASRAIVQRSFVLDQAQDRNGHGTHCIGTALGPKKPSSGVRRYGTASNAEIYVGKVLSDGGKGADAAILAGMDWAVANKCHVISMSLGATAASENEPFSQIYEKSAQKALSSGTLIVAAVGNDSKRPDAVWWPSAPANCPSIMAVGAVDQRLRTAEFSNAKPDILAPGVEVFSSLREPDLHGMDSGTSMATPHVAGIGAMWIEARPELAGAPLNLWKTLLQQARSLSNDEGGSLVQAPQ